MANKYLLRGLVPVPTDGAVVTKRVPKLTTSIKALFVGSPVLYDAGYAKSCAVTGMDDKVTGSVVALFNSYGKPVNKLNGGASGEAGYVEITYLADQQYRITSNDADLALADVGGIATLVNPDGDGTTAAEENQTFSLAVIDGGSINNADGSFEVVGIVDRLDNAVSVIGTEVLVRIEPTNYQAA